MPNISGFRCFFIKQNQLVTKNPGKSFNCVFLDIETAMVYRKRIAEEAVVKLKTLFTTKAQRTRSFNQNILRL